MFFLFLCANARPVGECLGTRQTDDGEEFWTPKEAAAYLRISTSTLYEYLRARPRNGNPSKLRTSVPPFRRLGRNVIRFPITKFKAWAGRYDHPEQESRNV